MATQGKIKTLYSDINSEEALFPRTKTNAVSDQNGVGLEAILDKAVYTKSVNDNELNAAPVNADTLNGNNADYFASKSYVGAEIAKAQFNGANTNVDLSVFATKDDLNAIDFPVDSINGKTGIVELTAEDVGAAPTGYGYGGQAVALSSALLRSDTDLETVLDTVYSSMTNRETKLIRFAGYPDNSDYSWFGILSKSSANYGSMFAHSSYNYGEIISKAKMGGTWKPLEWVNPPMVVGVEYRTTERWNGKAVYTILLDFGKATNAKIIDYTDLQIVGVVRHAGRVGGASIDSINNGSLTNEWTAYMSVGTTSAALFCGSSLLNSNCYLQLWYIKEDS